jgi:hypothetical protein
MKKQRAILVPEGTTTTVIEDGLELKVYRWNDGAEFWRHQNRLHRLSGPAARYPSGAKFWYIGGIRYTEEEHPMAAVRWQIEDADG